MPDTAHLPSHTRLHLFAATVATAVLAGCASPPAPVVTSAVTPATNPAPVIANPPSIAQPEGDTQAAADSVQYSNFAHWKQDFAPRARAAGISERTVRSALANAKLQPSIIKFDRAQPEFTRTPWQYLDSAVSAQRVKTGKLKMQEAASALQSRS